MPIRLWAAAAACLVLVSGPAVARGPMEPVLFGGSMDQPACAFSGKLVTQGDGKPVVVRDGPSMDFGSYGELQTGAIVHVCDEEQGWYGIVYGDEDCGVSSPIYERRPYDGPCHSGWLSRDAVRR